jgi:hypothetical protein
MRSRPGKSALTGIMILAGVGALVLPMVESDTLYIFDSLGNYVGTKTYDGEGSDGSRYGCVVGPRGGLCDNFCGVCHASSQVSDRTYTARVDWPRHKSVYFKNAAAPLAANQQIGWGAQGKLQLRGNELVLSVNGKSTVSFPAGSTIIRSPQNEVRLIALPATTQMRMLP